jgi:hypothetical protein
VSNVVGGVYIFFDSLLILKKLFNNTHHFVTRQALVRSSKMAFLRTRKTADIIPNTFSTVLRALDDL